MHMFYPYMFVCAVAGMEGWRHWALPWCLGVVGIFAGAAVATLAG